MEINPDFCSSKFLLLEKVDVMKCVDVEEVKETMMDAFEVSHFGKCSEMHKNHF